MAKQKKEMFENGEIREEIRINKYLSEAGMCSRREADKLIEAGQVFIDGVRAEMGSKVLPGQKVTMKGKEIERDEHLVLIAFNKPRGIVCTTDRREPDNIIDFIDYGSRIFPIGRLDKDSEGLILLTNDGEIVNKILRAGNHHDKEYIVEVNKPITAEFLKGMAGGVPILDTVTKPCVVEQLDKLTFRIVLTQGLNRQIRRMCEYFDYRVMALQRVRIMNINLGRLKLGGYRNLTDWELEELNLSLQESSKLAFDASEEIDEEWLPAEGVVMKGKTPIKKTGAAAAKARNFRKDAGERKSSERDFKKKGADGKRNRNKAIDRNSDAKKADKPKKLKGLGTEGFHSKEQVSQKAKATDFKGKKSGSKDSDKKFTRTTGGYKEEFKPSKQSLLEARKPFPGAQVGRSRKK